MRADLYLHHVRIFKTRSLAAQSCHKNNVHIGANTVKAGRDLKLGDILAVKREQLELTIQVLAFPTTRVSAALVAEFMKDLTTPEVYQKVAEARKERALIMPHKHVAKPDKKQLRLIRRWMNTK